MAGISSKAIGKLENKNKFNGIEHTLDLDLNQYDAFYRTMDPQLGRWWQIDPMTDVLESYSPYEGMGNNPINNEDPLGDFRTKFGAWLHKTFRGGGEISKNKYGEWMVSKSRTTVAQDGTPTITSSQYFGKGRTATSAYREKLLAQYESLEKVDEFERLGMWDESISDEHAGQRALGLSLSVAIPNLALKTGTNVTNASGTAAKMDLHQGKIY